MWINSFCKLCLIYSRTKDLINLGKEDKIPDLLIHLANIIRCSKSRSSAFVESFNVVKSLVNSSDPYIEVKAALNDVGKKLSNIAEKYLEERGWSIKKAMRLSAAANIIDTSVLGYEAKNLEEALWDKPAIEENIVIPKDEEIYFVLDNAGEALIDMLLVKALKIHGYNVSIVVRRESYEIDVLKSDLKNVEVIETPGSISPIYYIENGFIIAKGIANAEAYIEVRNTPSIHLLRTKCDVLSKAFNVAKNSTLIISGSTLRRILLKSSTS
ncbi:MAG: ARMT1-like domain-containing protein [Ignisphaera sp.]